MNARIAVPALALLACASCRTMTTAPEAQAPARFDRAAQLARSTTYDTDTSGPGAPTAQNLRVGVSAGVISFEGITRGETTFLLAIARRDGSDPLQVITLDSLVYRIPNDQTQAPEIVGRADVRFTGSRFLLSFPVAAGSGTIHWALYLMQGPRGTAWTAYAGDISDAVAAR